ncbi:glycoside hydrolase family 2 protein [Timonella sp. A28]|uniref:glycoside hydrolase family 2 protein n=1 Tax=Timonella sp. A28 TaxID=3442640 RepID=UPI003EBA69F8
MISQELHTGWTLRHLAGEAPAAITQQVIPAHVPGTVHTDLLKAGLINDPYVGMEEKALEWVHKTAWCYETTFHTHEALAGERIDLACDGLDTVARIMVNGHDVARTYNQHRSYRFDVAPYLRAGDNTLRIEFSSALEYAWQQAEEITIRPRAYDHPFNMVRKMACSFGWDWGPDLQTAGIWKPIRLERWSHVRATSTRTLVTVDEIGTGHIDLIMDLEWATPSEKQPAELTLQLAAAHGINDIAVTTTVNPGAATATARLSVPNAPLWWPAGYGEHPLFNITAELSSSRETRACYERRIGFRTVEINTTLDEHGTPFTLRVNGTDIFVKGANWIPDDHLLTRITRDRIERRVDQALYAHMNLLRVWGGGIYETEDFYDVCDERGIMVWQDFLLACAAYPEEEPFYTEFEAEARDNVARLTPHPSLVVWNGGNENLWGFLDWNWQKDLVGLTWGYNYYTDLFPKIVAELDPTRPYCDGSPYSPGFMAELEQGHASVHPNDQHHGTRHEWEVWNRQDYLTHLDYIPRFCSEFGHQGPPTWATLTRSISPEGRNKETAEFLLHQKAGDGNAKLDKGAAPHLPQVSDFEEWNWVTQLNQAHSVAFGIEHFRSFWPYSAGSIVWQLNDCWPVTSWAAVDGDEREKPLLFALRHAYAPRMITIKPRGPVIGAGQGAVSAAVDAAFGEDLPNGRTALGRPTAILINDTDETWSGTVVVTRENLAGTPQATYKTDVHVAPRSVHEVDIPEDLLATEQPTREVLVAQLDAHRCFHYFTELKNLELQPDAATWQVTDKSKKDGLHSVEIAVSASSLLVDSTLLVDRLDPYARIDDQLVTLRAGETMRFTVDTTLNAERIEQELNNPDTAHSVVRSVNNIRTHHLGV